jgi:hypothetical protein
MLLDIVLLRIVLRLLVTANDVPNALILVTPIIEAIRSSETSVLTRATLRSLPEDDIHQQIALLRHDTSSKAQTIRVFCVELALSQLEPASPVGEVLSVWLERPLLEADQARPSTVLSRTEG